jgi:hypothetical protein
MHDLKLSKTVQKIAFALTDGDLSKVDLTCPQCGHFPLTYSYAINQPPRLGFYIHCESCNLLHHFALTSKTVNFREDLILPQFQKLEDEAMEFASGALKDKLYNALQKALTNNPEHPDLFLREILIKWLVEGANRELISIELRALTLSLRTENREREENILLDVADYLSGWAQP